MLSNFKTVSAAAIGFTTIHIRGAEAQTVKE